MIKEATLADIAAKVLIPYKLIINWDHTGLQLVPTGTMHSAGDKIVPMLTSAK